MQKNSPPAKTDLSERPLRDFLGAGNGKVPPENTPILRFYTASADSGRSKSCRKRARLSEVGHWEPTRKPTKVRRGNSRRLGPE